MSELQTIRLVVEIIAGLGISLGSVWAIIRRLTAILASQERTNLRLDQLNGSVATAIKDNQAQDMEIATIKAYLEGQSGKRLGSLNMEEM